MRILLLLLGLTAVLALRKFANRQEFHKCIDTCERVITPCLHHERCHKEYAGCINHEDAYTCYARNRLQPMQKIAKCFD